MSLPVLRPKTRRLANGVTISVLPMPWVHGAFVGATVRAGSAYETAATHGGSHFLEHLHCATTKRFTDERKVQQALEEIGADFDAATSEDYTSYGMSVLPDRVRPAIGILAEIMTAMTARPEGVRIARRLILDEYRSTSPDEARVVDDCKAFLWGSRSPLARSVIGTRKSLDGLTPDRLAAYNRQAYAPGNLVVLLTGRFQTSEAQALETAFSGLRGPSRPWSYAPPSFGDRGPYWMFRSRKGEPTIDLLMMFPAFRYGDRRNMPLTLLEYILGQSAERLSMTLRLRKNPIYTYMCEQAVFRRAGVFSFKARVPPSQVGSFAEAVTEELTALLRHEISQAELELARTWYLRQLTFALDSPESLAGRLGLSHAYANHTSEQIDFAREIHRVSTLDRTELIQAMRDVMNPKRLRIAVVGNLAGRFRRELEETIRKWARRQRK